MRLISLLNQCYHFPGFVYVVARLNKQGKSIEVEVRERVSSKGKCSVCHTPAPTYDHQTVRRFEFVPFWGFMVFLLYRMRRVSCPHCGVRVEEVPWGYGKHQMTTAYVLFLAHWAKKLSWKETALSFRTSWDKVFQAVGVVVAWVGRIQPACIWADDIVSKLLDPTVSCNRSQLAVAERLANPTTVFREGESTLGPAPISLTCFLLVAPS